MSAVIDEVKLNPNNLIPNITTEEKNIAGARHSGVGVRLIVRLGGFVEENNLGGVYGPDATFVIGERDRLPDVSFISAKRIPADGEPESKWNFAPDLAVEIISPNDIYSEVEEKIYDYFNADVKQVWLISSEHKTVKIYDSPTEISVLTADDELTSEELLPGFKLKLEEIFKSPKIQD